MVSDASERLKASEEEFKENKNPENLALMHVKMYILGDKYDIPLLRNAAKERFINTIECNHKTMNISLIESVYEGTSEGDTGLREPVIKFALSHIRRLKESFLFDEMMQKLPDFTYDLCQALIHMVSRCPRIRI